MLGTIRPPTDSYPPAVPKPLAYSYVRFSTPEQVKGDSLRRQLELSAKYAEQHGLELDTALSLKDLGLSAFHKANLERGALGAFLVAIEQGIVQPGSYLLVESLDRLSRATVMDALELFSRIIRAGLTIVTLADGMVYSKASLKENWTQLIVSITIMARAYEESATKSQRLKEVWARKKSRAATEIVTSTVPAWLRIVGGQIVIDERKAATVRTIFRMVSEGYGLNLLERKLNQDGVPPIARATRWHRSYLIKVLNSRSVIGEYQPMSGRGRERKASGVPVKGYYPSLLTEEEFLSARSAITSRQSKGGRRGNGIANIFSGLVRCGYCAGPVRYVNKNAATRWQYLVCSDAKSGLGCKHVPWNYHEFEDAILSKLAGFDISAVLKDDEAGKNRTALHAAKAKVTDLQRRKTALIKLVETTGDIPEVAARLQDLMVEQREQADRVEELELEVKSLSTRKQHFAQFQKLRKSLDTADGEQLIEMRLRLSGELKRFLDKIEVFAEGAKPWSEGMKLAGVAQGREGRFAVAHFKNGEGRVLHGVLNTAAVWPGPHPKRRAHR
jgi:DNA invertase Pin-like site-specific DNA recombinase